MRLPYPVYDADHHFYDPADSITRHLPQKWKKDFQFVTVEGRTRLAIGGQISSYIPNPTFDRVAAPGSHLKYYRAENQEGLSLREMQGPAIEPPPSFRTRDARLHAMDEFGIDGALVFPNLFSVIESRMAHDHGLMYAVAHSLNEYIHEEWGFSRDGRLYAVPVISLADIDAAVAELDLLLARGARSVALNPGPVPGYRGWRSPGDPAFDPFWARINEAKIFVSLHASDSPYSAIANMWTGGREWTPFAPDPMTNCVRTIDRVISDTVAALICHGVFDRHPQVRIAAIENGAFWVEPLIKVLNHTYGQMPQCFRQHPVAALRRHIYVAPFNEDSFADLARHMDVSRILFGSDWPHPEGVAQPLDMLEELVSFDQTAKARIMGANLKGLLDGARD
jgi:predicted TIM-barrel fold metal-dependent hydrolase